MDHPFTLSRPRSFRNVISLAPMIDVMMILLVFFMVTSTYLDLDMIPAVAQQDAPPDSAPSTTDASAASARADTLLIRLGADGIPSLRGRSLDPAALDRAVRTHLQNAPLGQIIVLPSGAAAMQSLVSVMDIAAGAGAERLRVVRLEANP